MELEAWRDASGLWCISSDYCTSDPEGFPAPGRGAVVSSPWVAGVVPIQFDTDNYDSSLTIGGYSTWDDCVSSTTLPASPDLFTSVKDMCDSVHTAVMAMRFIEREVEGIEFVDYDPSIHANVMTLDVVGALTNPYYTSGGETLYAYKSFDRVGTYTHELGHGLGLQHEQKRFDRDFHIAYDASCVPIGDRGNFAKMSSTAGTVSGPFDFDSNMIYGGYSFGVDSPTGGNITKSAIDGVLDASGNYLWFPLEGFLNTALNKYDQTLWQEAFKNYAGMRVRVRSYVAGTTSWLNDYAPSQMTLSGAPSDVRPPCATPNSCEVPGVRIRLADFGLTSSSPSVTSRLNWDFARYNTKTLADGQDGSCAPLVYRDSVGGSPLDPLVDVDAVVYPKHLNEDLIDHTWSPGDVAALNGAWPASGTPGTAVDGERFGEVMASGDFDGDGIADLAVAVPADDAGLGSVVVYRGYVSAEPNGRSDYDYWTTRQDVSMGETFEVWSMVAADFDGDGRDDLAIGHAYDSTEEGEVWIYPGQAPWVPSKVSDGDFRDTADPAAGRYEDLSSFSQFGDDYAVITLSGRTVTGATKLDDLISLGSTTLTSEAGDQLGYALAADDLDFDGHADLIVGVPGGQQSAKTAVNPHNVVLSSTYPETGVVLLYRGSATDLLGPVDQVLHPYLDSSVTGSKEGARFGHAVATGVVDEDDCPDLVVGAPTDFEVVRKTTGGGPEYESSGSHQTPEVVTGQAYFFPTKHSGTACAFGVVGAVNVPFNAAGVGQTQGGTEFAELGASVAIGDLYDRKNPGEDVVLGAPGTPGPGDVPDAGVVFLFSGGDDPFYSGVSVNPLADPASHAEDVFRAYAPAKMVLQCESQGDRFGESLLVAPLDTTGRDFLVIGAPSKTRREPEDPDTADTDANLVCGSTSDDEDHGGVFVHAPDPDTADTGLPDYVFRNFIDEPRGVDLAGPDDQVGAGLTAISQNLYFHDELSLRVSAGSPDTFPFGTRSLVIGAPGADVDEDTGLVREAGSASRYEYLGPYGVTLLHADAFSQE